MNAKKSGPNATPIAPAQNTFTDIQCIPAAPTIQEVRSLLTTRTPSRDKREHVPIKFVILRQPLLQNPEINPAAKLVFGVISGRIQMGDKDYCWPSAESIGIDVGLSTVTV